MFRAQGLLALLTLHAGLVHSFSWDFVVARANTLEFYNNGTLEYTTTPATHRIKWLIYDPVHERVLFADKHNRKNSAYTFDVATKNTQSLIMKRPNRFLKKFAYDPATELLFGTVANKIFSFSIKSGNNTDVNGDLVINLESNSLRDVAVDSCGGYIYWIAANIIERALFNGSEREVVIDKDIAVKQGLTVDTQKLYWIESLESNEGGFSIESADLNGKNRKTLYDNTESDSSPDTLTISKDFISWRDSIEIGIFWLLPKNPPNDTDVKPKQILMTPTYDCSSYGSQYIAANYTIEERTQGVSHCKALKSLLPQNGDCPKADERLFCVNGTKISGESRCECLQGYIGERCDVSICHNYCNQGDCYVTAEGQPKCRCNAEYSGERCEVSLCHGYCLNNGICSLGNHSEPVCQCPESYAGKRCDISTCNEYCLQGNCSVGADGQPKCRCEAGYTGERCNVLICQNYCFQGDCSVSAEGQPKCRCNTGYSGERCHIDSCHDYCLNDGICSLNNHSEPVCQCTGQYEGERCAVLTVKSPKKLHESYQWLPIVDGVLPPNALICGVENKNMYIARANQSGSMCPGKYVHPLGLGYIPWGGEEHDHGKNEIEILCGSNSQWVKASPNNLPKNAFIGGHTGENDEIDGEPLYIGRAMIGDKLACGKVDPRQNLCYFPFYDKEETMSSCEILVELDDE